MSPKQDHHCVDTMDSCTKERCTKDSCTMDIHKVKIVVQFVVVDKTAADCCTTTDIDIDLS